MQMSMRWLSEKLPEPENAQHDDHDAHSTLEGIESLLPGSLAGGKSWQHLLSGWKKYDPIPKKAPSFIASNGEFLFVTILLTATKVIGFKCMPET
jgi:hypothetical protein